MAMLQSVSKIGNKIVPTSNGILQNVTTGIGADAGMRIIDGIFGSPVQRIFSFNIPILGTVGPIDFLNYIFHAGGFKFSKKGLIAVGAAKMASGTLRNIGPISLPGSSLPSTTSAQGTVGATGQVGGAT